VFLKKEEDRVVEGFRRGVLKVLENPRRGMI
jgi:hypothetical protein